MDAHNMLFWFSLASGVVALCAIGLFRFGRSRRSEAGHRPPQAPADRR